MLSRAGADTEKQQIEPASLLSVLLSGMLSQPAMGDKFGEACEGPTGFELADEVEEVTVGVDAKGEAVVDEGEGDGQALAAAHRAGEKEIAAGHGKQANAPFDPAVVDIKPAVLEA